MRDNSRKTSSEQWCYRRQAKKQARWPWFVLAGMMVIGIAIAICSMLHLDARFIKDSQEQSMLPALQAMENVQNKLEEQENESQDVYPEEEKPVNQNPITAEEEQALDVLLDSMPGSVSVWVEDIATGQTYTYQSDISFYCASILKAPYALWLSQRDEAGEIDLTTPMNGTTAWDLIYTLIANSSNDAAYCLAKQWPTTEETDFTEFLSQLGFSNPSSCEITEEVISGQITAEDGGAIMHALYEYFETNTQNAKQLQQAFLAADHDLLWLPDTAAKKYGSWDQALHDMAIVYTERPYIIVVFTNWGDTDVDFPAEGTARMQQIGKLVADIMEE